MKRLVAKRKSKKRCICCDKPIERGEVYYHQRMVFEDIFFENKIHGVSYYHCARCNYETARRKERREKFLKSDTCKHPRVELVWGLIAGEDYVQEPKYDQCLICKKVL